MDRPPDPGVVTLDAAGLERLRSELYHRSCRADERDQRADERERLADERERLADERERGADARERSADEREHRLDEAIAGRGASVRASQDVLIRAHQVLELVRDRIDRVEASLGREGAGWARDEAEIRREIAATEREHSGYSEPVARHASRP